MNIRIPKGRVPPRSSRFNVSGQDGRKSRGAVLAGQLRVGSRDGFCQHLRGHVADKPSRKGLQSPERSYQERSTRTVMAKNSESPSLSHWIIISHAQAVSVFARSLSFSVSSKAAPMMCGPIKLPAPLQYLTFTTRETTAAVHIHAAETSWVASETASQRAVSSNCDQKARPMPPLISCCSFQSSFIFLSRRLVIATALIRKCVLADICLQCNHPERFSTE